MIRRRNRRDPNLFAFGEGPPPRLDAEAEAAAPIETRIHSIWRYVVAAASSYAATLEPQERASYDRNDILGELCLALLERDPGWDPAKGRYATFAGVICRHALSDLRSRARTVVGPSNSARHVSRFQSGEMGPLGEEKARTLEKMSRIFEEFSELTLDTGPVDPHDDVADLADEEHRALCRRELRDAIRTINPVGALVLAHGYGMNGLTRRSVATLSAALPGRDVREERERAKREIRARIKQR